MRFSVIVPIYNTEKYLDRCIDTLVRQTYPDFELILVDDGSTDSCGALCDTWASKDARIQVIHKPNGGLVSARKAGIVSAQGEYIVHVDSDDWVEADYLERADAIISSNSPDIVTFAVRYCYDDREETVCEPIAPGMYSRDDIETTIVPNMLLTPSMTHMHYYVWAKVFKRDVVIPKQLAVDERISMGEDVSVTVPCYLDALSVYVSDYAVYHCRCHNASMSRKFNPNHYKDIEIGVQYLKTFVNRAPNVFEEEIERYCSFMCFVLLASAAQAGAKEQLSRVLSLWCNDFSHAFQVAKFDRISMKSKIAFFLLKRKKITFAYSFLRSCALIKGVL